MKFRHLVVGQVLLLTACAATPVTTPAQSPQASPVLSSASAASSPAESNTTQSPEPSATSGSGEALTLTASFDISPGTSYVTDVVAWSGGFLAIGSSWESEFHVTDELPAMWASTDGQTWEAQPVDLGVTSAMLVGVAERADGRLLLVGTVPGSGAVAEPVERRSAAWISEDSVSWQAIELPVADDALVDALAHGPKGYVLSAQTSYTEFAPNADQTPGELWFSSDGVEWTKTHEGASRVVAGDEGFVAMQSALAAGPSAVVASADGRTWIGSGPVGAPLLDVDALGGDWLATAYGGDPVTIRVMHSANGLDWTPVLDVNDLTGPDGPKTGADMDRLLGEAFVTGGSDRAYLMLGGNHCCAQSGWTYGVWVTSDGLQWSQVSSDGSSVNAVSTDAAATVLGGHLGRGEIAAFWLAQ